MAASQITLGNKLSMLTQAVSLVVLLVTIVLAWGRMDTRMTVAEGEIKKLDAQVTILGSRRDTDSAALATLAGEIKVQNLAISNLTSVVQKLDGQVEKLRPANAYRPAQP